MTSLDPTWLLAIVPFISAGAGAYLGGYLKKKGENLATHEDMDKLQEQVTAVTTITKEIEAKISNEVWDRQKRWELKRDIMFEALKMISEADNALRTLASTAQVQSQNPTEDFAEHWTKSLLKWTETAAAMGGILARVSIIADTSTILAFHNIEALMSTVASDVANSRSYDSYGKVRQDLGRQILELRLAVRKELGIELVKSADATN